MRRAPDSLTTERLTLRRPTADDANAIFAYAGDPEVTRYMSFPTHRSLDDTRAFLAFADREWAGEGVGSYLIVRDGAVIGSTGLHPDAPHRAETGYLLLRSRWGQGYATEACRAMIALGARLGFARIEAQVQVDHAASAHVLEKAGLTLEGVLRKRSLFPNLSPAPQDVRVYAWTSG